MALATFAIFITVECADGAEAYDQIDQQLDAGYLQDGINDGLSEGRVKCAVVRHVPAELLTEHNAQPTDD